MSEWLIDRFSDYAKRDFLAQSEASYTYSELAEFTRRYSDYFAGQGIQAGDVVTLEADYSMSSIASLFALFRLKTIVAPITNVSDAELKRRRSAVNAKWNVRPDGDAPLPELALIGAPETTHPLVEQLIASNSPGLILFSSGSTGKPKAMIHDVDQLLNTFSKKRSRPRRILIFLLFDHIGGLNTLFNALASGALIVVPPSRDPNAVAKAIQHHQVNLLPASPTFLNLLLISGAQRNFDLSSLRFITYGTEPMPESLLLRLKAALPKVAFIQTFGTSETGISQTISQSSSSTRIKISDPDTEHQIVNGELWLRSKTQILGYLNHDMSRFTEDGWFKTGDIVEQSANGFLTIKGRREDVINVGGEKVSPLEVESTLLEIPEVADCLVYGEPNVITGQIVAAEIVLRTGALVDLKKFRRTVKQYCRKYLSPYKVPARITFNSATRFNERYKKNRNQR